jgi:hypothetical protein
VETTAQFVTIRNDHVSLTLARRHGGVPVELIHTDNLISWPADLYTDWGIYDKGRYFSADGDTNPRLEIRESATGATVTFRGKLHERSWNGVQTCGLPDKPADYRLSYTIDNDRITITLGIKPSVDLPNTSAFYALHFPITGFRSWRQNGVGGNAGDRPGVRIAESRTDGSTDLQIDLHSSIMTLESQSGFQDTFLIDSSHGNASIFLALLDGKKVDLRAGEELTGSTIILLKYRE